ncbi:hypothetical protein EON79_04520 [bacterium]|nr:MAG: hypothetical protein EON79_04520 [bacterium]
MIAIGIAHLASPAFFVSIMPPYLPFPEMLVLTSGLAEIAGGIGLMIVRTRVWAGWGLVLLLVCVFPANVNMALHPGAFPVVLLWLRLLLQPALIWLAWWVGPARSARHALSSTRSL